MALMVLATVTHPPERSPRGNPGIAAGPLRAASCASGGGGGSEAGARGAFCSAIELKEGKAPERIRIFPKGPELETVSYDSRRWRLSDPAAVAAASMADGLDLPIDWEHARARKAKQGQRIPTAGWIKGMEVRDGVLEGRVEWTAEGRASVESREYRYFSPYFHYEKASGEVAQVLHGGLVGSPAFVMPALAGAQEGNPMKKILKALGLAAGATEEKAAEAIAALKSERDGARASASAPSLDEFVPRADYDALATRVAAAETRAAGQADESRNAETKRLLDKAQAAGQITPATRSWHEKECRKDGGIERFKALLAKAPVIAGASGVPGSPPGAGGSAASADEKRVAALFGHKPEFVREHASPLPGGGS